MPVTLLKPNDITLIFADTEAGLTTGADYKCQIQNATVTPTPTYTTIGATGCQGETQSLNLPVPETLDLTWLQDWTAEGGGLANYCRTNAGQIKWFSYIPVGDIPELTVSGQVEIVPVALGGDMGVPSIAGPVSMPIQGVADVAVPAVVPLTAAADADTDAA
jgi:hypothetical protein